MPSIRRLYVLQEDVRNTDRRRDAPEEFLAGDVFVHEIVLPRKGRVSDMLVSIDDEDMPVMSIDHGTPLYDTLFAHLRRAQPGLSRLLHEYSAYTPETVPLILAQLVQSGGVTLQQVEDAVIRHRQENDYDLLDDDDIIALPKPGHSKLDPDEGLTDPAREDFDPRVEGYGPPGTAEEETDEDYDAETDEDVEATRQAWCEAVQRAVRSSLGRDEAVPEAEASEGWDAGETPNQFAADWIAEHGLTAAKPKQSTKAPKASKRPTKKQIAALAEKVYEALAQTPGKTRRLATLQEMTGAGAAVDVCRAMDLLHEQGRIDGKGRIVGEAEKN